MLMHRIRVHWSNMPVMAIALLSISRTCGLKRGLRRSITSLTHSNRVGSIRRSPG